MVLGISNRTENWKTAQVLSCFFGGKAKCLARLLGEPLDTDEKVKLELYWKGIRDWYAMKDDKTKQEKEEQLMEEYSRVAHKLKLRERIGKFGPLRVCLKD